jgi:hypothetical protein
MLNNAPFYIRQVSFFMFNVVFNCNLWRIVFKCFITPVQEQYLRFNELC